MNHIQAFSNILRIRTKFKRLQQLSWTISKLEKQFDPEQLQPEELISLFETYISLIGDLKVIYDELKDEQNTGLD